MLEKLLAGVSPAAKRGITLALIVIAWAGFLLAVLAGVAAGLIFIAVGFILCWFAASALGAKSATVHEPPAPGSSPVAEEPQDIESRIRKRLESMKSEDEAD